MVTHLRTAVAVGALMVLAAACQTTQAPEAPRAAAVVAGDGLLYGGSPRFTWPVQGRITSFYGKRSSGMHYGLDVAAPYGSKIRAVSQGLVIKAGWQKGYGRTVIINHGPLRSLYAHCARLLVARGDRVAKGQVVALVGQSGRATGAHLHFEVRSPRWAALNPLDYLPLQRNIM